MIISKEQKNLSNSEFIAPEIIFDEIDPNIISDIYSIGAIMKFLLKNTKSFNNVYAKLIKDCLQIDPDKRIKFDILALNSYFTSIPTIYKPFRGNLTLNIRLFLHMHLHQRK